MRPQPIPKFLAPVLLAGTVAILGFVLVKRFSGKKLIAVGERRQVAAPAAAPAAQVADDPA